MKHLVQVGTVDYTALLKLIRSSSTTGAPLTGLTYLDVDFAYTRVETDNDVTVTGVAPATLASLTAAHSDWGFIKVDDTEAPGLYRLDIADAVFAAGAWSADVTVRQAYATTVALQTDLEFQLVSFNPFDSVRMGLTALPNAAADAAGGLPISDAGGLDLDMISTTAYATKTNTTTLITTCDSIKTVASATKTNTDTLITTANAIHTHAESIETVGYITRTNTDTLITTANAIHTHVQTIETNCDAIHTHAAAVDDLTKAAGAGDLAVLKTTCLAVLTDTGTTLDGKIDTIDTLLDTLTTVCDAILTDTGTTLDTKINTLPSATRTAMETDGSKLDHIWEMTEDDGGTRRYTVNSLENAPSGEGASAAVIADAVWDELIADHNITAGTMGKALSDVGVAADPWGITVPAAYTAGMAGYILDTIQTVAYATRTNTATIITVSDAIHTHVQTVETNCDAIKTNTATLITNCDAIKTNTATIITTCDAIHTHAGSIETVAYITRTNTDTIITTANAIHTHAESIETVSYATRTLATAIDTLSKAGGDGDLAIIKTTALATLTDTGTTLDGKIDAISTVAYATRTLATAIDTLTKAGGDGDLAAILLDTGTTLDSLIDGIVTVCDAIHTHVTTIDTASLAIHTHVDTIEDVLANKMVVTEADGSTTIYADDDATPLLTCTLTSTLGRTTRTKLA